GAHAVGDVVLHDAAPLLVAGVTEGVAEPGGASELGLQNRVATRSKELHQPVKLRIVACRGATVWQHHKRPRARLTNRRGEVGWNAGAIARLVGYLLEVAQLHARQGWIFFARDIRAVGRKV